MSTIHIHRSHPEVAMVAGDVIFNADISDDVFRLYAKYKYSTLNALEDIDVLTQDEINRMGEGFIAAGLGRKTRENNRTTYTIELEDADDDNDTDLDQVLPAPSLSNKTPKPTGYVYLIQSPTGAYKIGRTTNVEDRIKMFEVKLPFEIELLHVITCQNHVKAEQKLHTKFDNRRINGEWFALTPIDIEWLKTIQTDDQL